MELRETIKTLCAANAPSGFEDAARDAVKERLAPFVDELSVDALGNLFALKRCGRPNAKSLLLDAHMDEIGLIVTGYEKGFLRFGSLGGIDPRMLPAREVFVLTDPPIRGIIDTMPPHVLSADEMDKSIESDKLFIDVGLSEEAAKEKVKLGTPAVFAGEALELGDDLLCSKALDDRSCAAIILKTMENISGESLSIDVIAMLSTQEEVGGRGARVGAFGANPDWAIAIDVTHGSTPDAKKAGTFALGGGPAIGVGPASNRALSKKLFAAAGHLGIKCRTEVLRGSSGTNGDDIMVSRAGVATAVLSLPLKYMHSPIETISISDAENTVKLLTGLITSMDGEGEYNA